MTELSSDAQALVEAGRKLDQPSHEDRARVRAQLVARLGAGALVATLPARAGGGGASLGRAARSGLRRALLAAGAALGLLTAVWLTSRSPAPPRPVAPSIAMPQRARPSEPLELAPPPAANPEAAPVASAPAVEPAPAARALPPRRRKRPSVVATRDTDPGAAAGEALPTTPSPASTLREELALLARAQRALRDQQPEQALAIAQRHAREYPAGVLREERSGIEALALCKLGRGLDAARSFLERAPSSPLAARIRAECKP